MKKLRPHYRKIVHSLVVAAVVALLIFQAMIDLSVLRSVIQVRPDYGTILPALIGEAADQLNKPAPVDPVSGKIYIPEAHVVMPPYNDLGQIEYMYESGKYTSNNADEIHLTSTNIINLAKNRLTVDNANANNRMAWQSYNSVNFFGDVPSLQACIRGVQVFFSKPNLGGDYLFQGSRKLNDGRTLYIYRESQCKEDESPVIDLIKQSQSY